MRRKKLRGLYVRIALLTVMCVIVGRGVWGMAGTFMRAHSEAREATNELAKAHERAAHTGRVVADIGDPLEREAELRARFDVGNPGEHLLTVIDDELVRVEETQGITWFDRLRAAIAAPLSRVKQ